MEAVIGVLIAIVLFATAYLRRVAENDGPVFSKRRTFRRRGSAFALVWLLVWPVWLGLIASNVVDPTLAGIAGALLLTPVCIPWLLVRLLVIPLGLPRIAWVLTHGADWTWGRDRSGGAALAAVLAASARRRSTDLRWARDRLQRIDLLGGAGVVAAALMADIDGDSSRTEALMLTLESFDPRVVPKTAQHIAIEHRILGALKRGAMADVVALDVQGSRFGHFARACARRLSGVEKASALSNLKLRCLWLLAPRRRRARTLLSYALQADLKPQDHRATTTAETGKTPAATTTTTRDQATTTTDETATLPRALALHVLATKRSPPRLDDVQALAQAWAPALKVAARDLVTRARALGVHNIGEVSRGLEETVTTSLCDLIAQIDLSLVDVKYQPLLLQTAIERVRSERLDALDTATAALRLRTELLTDLASVDELREVATLRALALAVYKTGNDARALAYDACQWTLCELAVRLWNVRAQPRLANAIFRMLLTEATALHDTKGTDTHTANVKCGP